MKVLIAEDDVFTRLGLKEIMEGEGYSTCCAENGVEAFELFGRENPDLLCLDIMMPELNGYDLCRKIRKTNSEVPIIFISAKTEEIDKVVGLELGADDYITKPFGVREVLARVKAVMRRSIPRETAEAESFPFGRYRIDTSTLEGTDGDQIITFTPRELTLLLYFYENKGKVLTRDQLYDKGWGVQYLPSSRSLDQFISQLRKKVEEDPAKPDLIITVPTAGYKHP